MKGDFSRDTFDPKKHFLRVLMQQGRVQIDADWNEQVSILLHYMQSLAADLLGPYAKPKGDFEIIGEGNLDKSGMPTSGYDETTWGLKKKIEELIAVSPNRSKELGALLKDFARLKELTDPLENGDFIIGPGHYYVDGLLVENDKYLRYSEQSEQQGYPFREDGVLDIKSIDVKIENGILFAYLDVWERHLAWYEEPSNYVPGMREAALGPYGPDTATRSKVVWQVKVREVTNKEYPDKYFDEIKNILIHDSQCFMKAMAQPPGTSRSNLCETNPKSKYRGPENHLYRVEIHRSGDAGTATFKWSRDNGSVVFPIIDGTIKFPENKMTVNLAHLGLDERFTLKKGDWVEFVHEDYILQNRAEPLLQVEEIDLQTMEVILVSKDNAKLPAREIFKQPLLRRWDQFEIAKPSGTGARTKLTNWGDFTIEENKWTELEDGILIQFVSPATSYKTELTHEETREPIKAVYHTGDYWLIPARVATGNVEWPAGPNEQPKELPPHGIKHHYAPLASLSKDASGKLKATPLANCIKNDNLVYPCGQPQ